MSKKLKKILKKGLLERPVYTRNKEIFLRSNGFEQVHPFDEDIESLLHDKTIAIIASSHTTGYIHTIPVRDAQKCKNGLVLLQSHPFSRLFKRRYASRYDFASTTNACNIDWVHQPLSCQELFLPWYVIGQGIWIKEGDNQPNARTMRDLCHFDRRSEKIYYSEDEIPADDLKAISRDIQRYGGHAEEYAGLLSEKAAQTGILVEVQHRVKGPASLYSKMKYMNLRGVPIFDINGVRLVCGSVDDCYNLLQIVSDNIDVRYVRDYIAVPKATGYQSLIARTVKQIPIEVQIQTKTMYDAASTGAAGDYHNTQLKQQINFVRQWIDWEKETGQVADDLDDALKPIYDQLKREENK